jgi:hypothetical protein
MSMLFSITVDCDDKGKIDIWSQQSGKLSPENLEKLTRMLSAIKRVVNNETAAIELPFAMNNEKLKK